ncbi:hypothetical protein GQ53DRAFT_362824 [Thozetella sp. PMI_491]|nr:hypothetical protein GQ53DRAFT_362824 [Thozetella sp. PMI_491]
MVRRGSIGSVGEPPDAQDGRERPRVRGVDWEFVRNPDTLFLICLGLFVSFVFFLFFPSGGRGGGGSGFSFTSHGGGR